MNSDDLRLLLAERAADAGNGRVDRLGEVHHRVRAARRARALGAVAAALVLVAGIGVAVGLPGTDEQSEGPVAPPDPAPTDPLDQYRVVPDTTSENAVPLEPGPWMVQGNGRSSMPRVVLDVPRDYRGAGAYLYPTRDRSDVWIGYWNPTHVSTDPCGRAASGTTAVSTAAEMAAALARQRRSRTTAPEPVSIGGYDGVSLELTVTVDPKTCADGVFQPFATFDGGRWVHDARETDRYWILDVEGEVLLLNTVVRAGVTDAQREEMARVVESAEFEQPG